MSLWDKIRNEVQSGAATFTEKAADIFKSSADVLRGGMESVSQKAAYASKLAKLKWELNMLHREIEKAFTALGGQTYELSTQGKLADLETVAKDKLALLQQLEQALASKEKEIADLPSSMPDSQGAHTHLKKDLASAGGTIEQIILTDQSTIVNRPLKDIELPTDLLIGTVVRGQEVIFPEGSTVFQVGDRVTLLGKKAAVEATIRKIGGVVTSDGN